jgi:hypothetical protein
MFTRTAQGKHLSPTQPAERLSLRKFLWVAPLTLVAAIIADEILYAIAAALIPSIGQWPMAGPFQIILSTFAYLILGSIVFALVVRFSSRPVRTYWIAGTIALIVSLALPISAGAGFVPPGLPIPDTATVVTLAAMHVVAYLVTASMFTQLTRTAP